MTAWTTAYVNALPDSAFACVDDAGRHYPHHSKSGAVDLPHLRNALSRVAQDDTISCGRAHLEAHAKEAGVGTKAEISFNERQRLVQVAIQKAYGDQLYICELYDDRAIYEAYGEGADAGKSFAVPYTLGDEGAVELGERTEVKRETVYTAVKFVDGSDGMIEGLAIPFGGPVAGKDLHGEDFGPDTDYAFDWFPEEGRPTIFHHGVDRSMKTALVGRQVEREELEAGHWAKVQLDKSAKYLSKIQELVDAGRLWFSSGSMPHLVQTTKSGHITRWPWVELSLTPTPANPLATTRAMKAVDVFEHLAAVDATVALKYLESEGGSESEPFAVQADRIAAGLDAFAVRAELRREWRAKAGRALSTANRAAIAEVAESLRPLGEVYARLQELLERTDPDAAPAAKAAELEFLRFLREQARQNGVQVDA